MLSASTDHTVLVWDMQSRRRLFRLVGHADAVNRAIFSPQGRHILTAGADVHPYRIEGGVAEVTMRVLLRDFETARLAEKADLVRQAARLIELEYPGASVDVAVTPQYRNMAEGLKKEPRALAFAEEAMRRAGLAPKFTIVRGGTDGSRLTELGLPTPNLSCGEHNLHSPLEWTCLEEMATASQVLVELAKLWGEERE